MADLPEELEVVAQLPIEALAEGEVAPPMEPRHESWELLANWNDPLAPWAGYRVSSEKKRVTWRALPAIEWKKSEETRWGRAFVTGERTWRDYSLRCRVQALEERAHPTPDDWGVDVARAGLVFRIETSRRFYYFCLEGKRRLVLYRRIDDEWFELASDEIEYGEQIVTLVVALDGDGIRASCPEMDVDLFATDTLLACGRGGFRALGKCRLFDLSVHMIGAQRERNERLAQKRAAHATRLGESVPDAEKVGEISLAGGRELLECTDFCQVGRHDLLFRDENGLTAETWDGEELWHLPEVPVVIKVASDADREGRRIYTLVGERKGIEMRSVRGIPTHSRVADEMVAVDGSTGRLEGRVTLPEEPQLDLVRRYDVSYETGRLVSDTAVDICVRQWRRDCGDGGRDIWAYDADLNMLWHQIVDPPYGHHNAVHLLDLDGDGREEVLAGGTLISPDGEVMARHDMAEEMARINGAGHYDAVVAGNFGDPESDPIAFIMGGSAGVYVVDPLSGKTLAVHRTGHAQWGLPCKVRDDLPGRQLLTGTRWANFGIITLLSGRGERMWTLQPDYILQGTRPVQWFEEGPQHIWLNTSAEAQGLYDGYGNFVRPLDPVRQLWKDHTPMDINSRVLRRSPKGPDLLAVQVEDRIHLFAPEE